MRAKLYIPAVDLGSTIGKLTVALEPIRNREISGTTPPWIFFELKIMFQTLESWASARIEGNHTTVVDLVEAAREDTRAADHTEATHEIENIEKGIDYIEGLQKTKKLKIDKDLVLRLHRIVVEDLDPNVEGDTRAGNYRNGPRRVGRHQAPPWSDVPDFMEKLFDFIKEKTSPEGDLLKIAVVHHRFVWIHPFGNGNGRVVRLLTYAMLAKAGFIDENGYRLLDPTAVLGKNRQTYGDKLASADACTDEGLLEWSEYMIQGIRDEATKIDRLLDANFTRKNIILPALEFSLEKQRISVIEYEMLKIAANNRTVKASNFTRLFPGTSRAYVSIAIRKLKDQHLLRPVGKQNARQYTLRFTKNALTLGIVTQLDKHGFIPVSSAE